MLELCIVIQIQINNKWFIIIIFDKLRRDEGMILLCSGYEINGWTVTVCIPWLHEAVTVPHDLLRFYTCMPHVESPQVDSSSNGSWAWDLCCITYSPLSRKVNFLGSKEVAKLSNYKSISVDLNQVAKSKQEAFRCKH